jgi:hypothetical protein
MSPQPSLASERARRASTARNTPAPDSAISATGGGGASAKPASSRAARRKPAPGVVGAASSGGKSAVGKRTVAPKQRRRKDQPVEDVPVGAGEEDDEIDPDEQRYCLCNGVSFGTMILCENEVSVETVYHEGCMVAERESCARVYVYVWGD